ncbi:MAG: hypothetical protein IJ617_03400, partial [Oscillospiraceae bacterium]|nr:hypothetical protein [Oscillospiraceae bacterium]
MCVVVSGRFGAVGLRSVVGWHIGPIGLFAVVGWRFGAVRLCVVVCGRFGAVGLRSVVGWHIGPVGLFAVIVAGFGPRHALLRGKLALFGCFLPAPGLAHGLLFFRRGLRGRRLRRRAGLFMRWGGGG